MIYRVFTGSREYFLTGTPGIDLKRAFGRFRRELSDDPEERREQLLEVLDYHAPGEEPREDLEGQAFVAVVRESLDLRARGLTEVDLSMADNP